MRKTLICFEPDPNHFEIVSTFVDDLISKCKLTMLLETYTQARLRNAKHIKEMVDSWPRRSSRPWIIAGNIHTIKAYFFYQGTFFIRDGCNISIIHTVNKLLMDFDWVLLPYFTTLHNEHYNFITKTPELAATFMEKNSQAKKFRYLTCHTFLDDPLSCFRMVTFSDKSVEGLYVYDMAIENGQSAPLLLCIFNQTHDVYHKWNAETGLKAEKPWFEESISKLELIKEVSLTYIKYHLYRITDINAYLDIWAEVNEEHTIAEATLSADTDIEQLAAYLEAHKRLSIENDQPAFCSWAYSQVYGEGESEHHAIFWSKDAEITNLLCSKLGRYQINRFL